MFIISLTAIMNLVSAIVIFTNKGNMSVGYFNLICAVILAIYVFFGSSSNSNKIENKPIEYCSCKKPTSGYKEDDYWICTLCDHVVNPLED